MSSTQDAFAIKPGLRVLVTAGASGIGRAISDMLIAHGAKVHICDVSDVFISEFSAVHPSIGASRADVSSEGDVERLFADVKGGSLADLTR